MKKLITSVMTMGLAIAPAVADEVWDTEIGMVIYEADLDNGMAVLSYPLEDTEARGFGFFYGLAGEFTGRSGYDGIWIEPAHDGEEGCGVEMNRPDNGEASSNWGRLKLVFVDPDFPGSWVAMRGDCFDDPTEMLVGRPVTALPE